MSYSGRGAFVLTVLAFQIAAGAGAHAQTAPTPTPHAAPAAPTEIPPAAPEEPTVTAPEAAPAVVQEPAEAPPVTASPRARLDLRSGQEEIIFHWRSSHPETGAVAVVWGWVGPPITVRPSGKEYARLCEAPCAVALPAGATMLGLSQHHSGVVATAPIELGPRMQVEGTYVSRRWARTAGVLTGVTGIAAGLLWGMEVEELCVPITNVRGMLDSTCSQSRPHLGKGMVIVSVSAVVGGLISLIRDSAEIRATPLPGK